MLQFWLARLSLVALVVGLFLIFSSNESADPVAGISSIRLLISMILFGVIALPVVRGRR